jgi:hypothetical protein
MATVVDLRLELLHASSPVWRALRVPGDLRLDDLHHAIQVVMGWEDYHLHCFDVGGREYGPRPDDEFEDHPEWAGEDSALTIAQAFADRDGPVRYHYHDWLLALQVIGERVATRSGLVVCLDGEGEPPSDGSQMLPFRVDVANADLKQALRPRATPDMPAGPNASADDQLLAHLTLLVLFLGSWETRYGPRESWKNMRFEILDSLQEAGLIDTTPRRKSVVLTDLGVERAKAMRDRLAEGRGAMLPPASPRARRALASSAPIEIRTVITPCPTTDRLPALTRSSRCCSRSSPCSWWRRESRSASTARRCA